MADVRGQLLQAIERHDGAWGWYQLDRIVNPLDLPNGKTVMDVLKQLESEGLVRQNPGTPQNKYTVTDLGRVELAKDIRVIEMDRRDRRV